MLIKENLTSEIRKINDESYSLFEGFPTSDAEVVFRWSEAIRVYSQNIIPFSSSIAQAALGMQSSLISTKGSTRTIELSITSYATILAAGMPPLFVGIPPVLTLDFSDIYAKGLEGGSSRDIADLISDRIHKWFLLGTAINNSSGVTINWS